jgi:hypothetical protein
LTEAGVPRFTTEDLLECERAILDGADPRLETGTGVAPDHVIAAVLARSQPALNSDQAATVRSIATSGTALTPSRRSRAPGRQR